MAAILNGAEFKNKIDMPNEQKLKDYKHMENKIFKVLNFLTLSSEKGLTKSATLNLIISGFFLPFTLFIIDIRILAIWSITLLLVTITLIIKDLK